MGILNFTILSLGLVSFIKILFDIYNSVVHQYNEKGTIEREKKVEISIVAIGIVCTLLIILTADSFVQGDIGIITVLLTPITYFIYKSIKYLLSYLKSKRHNKSYVFKDISKGWKVVPYGDRRLSDFSDRNELEIYRIHTLIKNILRNNCGYSIDAEDCTTINVNYDDFQVEITLEVLNSKINRKVRTKLSDIRLKKEGKLYVLLKKELLPYTYMIDGSTLKLGNNTLIARVDYCDIKVNIKRCA